VTDPSIDSRLPDLAVRAAGALRLRPMLKLFGARSIERQPACGL